MILVDLHKRGGAIAFSITPCRLSKIQQIQSQHKLETVPSSFTNNHPVISKILTKIYNTIVFFNLID